MAGKAALCIEITFSSKGKLSVFVVKAVIYLGANEPDGPSSFEKK